MCVPLQTFTYGNINKRQSFEDIEDIIDKSHRKLVMIVERKFGKEMDYLNQLKSIQNMPIGHGIHSVDML